MGSVSIGSLGCQHGDTELASHGANRANNASTAKELTELNDWKKAWRATGISTYHHFYPFISMFRTKIVLNWSLQSKYLLAMATLVKAWRCAHRDASSWPEGSHSPQVLIFAFHWHRQDGGVRVAHLVVVIDERDTPLAVR